VRARKTVQELLPHPNSSITLDIYTPAVKPAKRAAQTKVVEMIVRKTHGGRTSIRLIEPFRTYAVESGACN
jgi:hypothetical protein